MLQNKRALITSTVIYLPSLLTIYLLPFDFPVDTNFTLYSLNGDVTPGRPLVKKTYIKQSQCQQRETCI